MSTPLPTTTGKSLPDTGTPHSACTPYHAWERGVNENTNGLIRDFFPKGTDFATIHPATVAKVERLLNRRPRKSLGFQTPNEVFHALAQRR